MLRSRGGLRTESSGLDISALRAGIEMGGQIFGPEAGTATEAVSADGVPGEWITGPGASDAATIYYLHGGGHAIGSIDSHRGLISRLSKASGARAFAIDYRLAPENPYPAGLEDSVKAYRWLLAQGIEASSIVIAGDSAGGNLALTTLLALKDAGESLPAATVLLSPWTDLTGSGDSMQTRVDLDPMIPPDPAHHAAVAYAGDTPLTDPLVSPLFGDLSGLPPMLIHVGDYEVLLDDSTRLAEKAKAAGVDVTLEVWPEMIHVWQFFAPMVPEATEAIEVIGKYIRSHVPAEVTA
jgi:acetyl esterase/lipase